VESAIVAVGDSKGLSPAEIKAQIETYRKRHGR